jgi:putative endonuclease
MQINKKKIMMTTFTKIRSKAKQLQEKKKSKNLSNLAKGYEVELWVKQMMQKEGFVALDQNVRTPFGEIDLIMLNQNELVFIEVRYRQHWSFGDGAESVTWAKQQRIIRSAHTYLARKPKYSNFACRFDVISVSGSLQNLKMSWIPAAFTVE